VRIFSQHQEIEKLVVANIEPIDVKFFLETRRMEGECKSKVHSRRAWRRRQHAFLFLGLPLEEASPDDSVPASRVQHI
jgi:hypothetical protein